MVTNRENVKQKIQRMIDIHNELYLTTGDILKRKNKIFLIEIGLEARK